MHRERRRWWQKAVYSAVYRCGECGAGAVRWRKLLRLPAVSARCPRCGSGDLEVYAKRDKVEGFRGGVWRRAMGAMGARLYYCSPCRLQFYDARGRKKRLGPRMDANKAK